MSQLKQSHGNMYPWVTHMHAHIGGECPHHCSYCYVEGPPESERPAQFTGPIRLLDNCLSVNYGSGRVIFIDHMNDLFAQEVPDNLIHQVLGHTAEYPDNTYVFQTKNPRRYHEFIGYFGRNALLGTTIETNRDLAESVSKAPQPFERAAALYMVPGDLKVFMTIEPILDFDVDVILSWINAIQPEFVNIGADSKNHGLVEPTEDKILALIKGLQKRNIEIREKHNLQRLVPSLPGVVS